MTFRVVCLAIIAFIVHCTAPPGSSQTSQNNLQQTLPVSAPITIESSGKSGAIAVASVMRVVCTSTNMGGTAFLHKSGRVITAAHVVADCQPMDLLLILSSGKQVKTSAVVTDAMRDLSLLTPVESITGPALPLSTQAQIAVGTQVTTWGFPAGYSSVVPLLTVGYLAGLDRVSTPIGLSPPRWVVNAAFNGGNSGGPVLSLEDGSVIGVVSSKLAPIPPLIESALEALSKQQSGFTFTKSFADGSQVNVSEGQVIAEVLKYLRSQTQLVLGHAVTGQDLRAFLQEKGIEP